jgi:hypothetical protein
VAGIFEGIENAALFSMIQSSSANALGLGTADIPDQFVTTAARIVALTRFALIGAGSSISR